MKLRQQLIVDYYAGTLLHVLLKPFVILAGKIMRRDHDLANCRSVTVIKMLGGGSLVIAYPALIAMKQAPGVRQLRLLTTPAVKPFAESLGVFDEILVIRIHSALLLCLDSLVAVRRLFLCDAIVDLEIHSRLTTVLALMTCARNRVGFYTVDSFWRSYLSTHLVFCNITSGTYYFYDQIAGLFGAHVLEFAHYQREFRRFMGVQEERGRQEPLRIAIAPCTSDLGTERMLRTEEWVEILQQRLSSCSPGQSISMELFGAPRDRTRLNEMAAALQDTFPGVQITNRAGEGTLLDSIRGIARVDEVFCVDSSLAHYSRLLGTITRSWWGPTDPKSRLRPWPDGGDDVHYASMPCSPCVHLTQYAPCRGNNICMRLAVNPELPLERNPVWLVAHETATRFTRPNVP